MLQGVGDTMAHIAAPRPPPGGRKDGRDDACRARGAAVTHHVHGPPTAHAKREEHRLDPCPGPGLAQAQANDLHLMQRQGFALADGRDGDPQHDEGVRAPHLDRTIGEAYPRRIEGALSLLEAMEAETQGPLTPCRAVRHPGDEASAHQKHGAEHCARGAERAGTAKYQMKREITEKKRVLSMVEGAGARVRALCS